MRKLLSVFAARFSFMLLLTLSCIGLLGRIADGSIVQFYTDRTLFEAALTSSTNIDFEGIVADDKTTVNPVTLEEVFDGVRFSVPFGAIAVSGRNGEYMQDAPFDSAILFSNASTPITASLPDGTNAVGGFFGNIHRAGVLTTITVESGSGVLDSRSLVTDDMGAETESNFFGWIVSGESIVRVTHDLEGGFVNNGDFDGIDDFVYGVAASPIPEPSTLAIWSLLGVIGLVWCRRRGA